MSGMTWVENKIDLGTGEHLTAEKGVFYGLAHVYVRYFKSNRNVLSSIS